MSLQHPIYFHFIDTSFTLKDRKALKFFIMRLFQEERKKVESINYIFCTDDYLLNLNKSYLKHFTLTDIITFELSTSKDPAISDIYISIERVRENAKTFDTTFTKEILRVIFHGALHLCGFKDKTKKDKDVMRIKEDYYLNKYLVSRGTL